MFVCARVHLSFVKYILIQTFARTESSLKVGARFCPTHWILRFPRVHTETLQSQWSYAALLGHSGFKQVLDSENKEFGLGADGLLAVGLAICCLPNGFHAHDVHGCEECNRRTPDLTLRHSRSRGTTRRSSCRRQAVVLAIVPMVVVEDGVVGVFVLAA